MSQPLLVPTAALARRFLHRRIVGAHPKHIACACVRAAKPSALPQKLKTRSASRNKKKKPSLIELIIISANVMGRLFFCFFSCPGKDERPGLTYRKNKQPLRNMVSEFHKAQNAIFSMSLSHSIGGRIATAGGQVECRQSSSLWERRRPSGFPARRCIAARQPSHPKRVDSLFSDPKSIRIWLGRIEPTRAWNGEIYTCTRTRICKNKPKKRASRSSRDVIK